MEKLREAVLSFVRHALDAVQRMLFFVVDKLAVLANKLAELSDKLKKDIS